MKLAITLAGALALAASTARADNIDDVFKTFANPDRPGCAVGVARKGEPAVLRGYGVADLEHAVPITADTVFEAGSVSKQFTAATVLTLVQAGKIALGDDIRKYLPEMPDYGAPITIDMLLSHTSGLRDWGEVAALGGWPRGSRAYTNDEALVITARQKALNYPPGETWSYTNTGYNLLALIVSRVSGQSFAAYSKVHVFEPLGMSHTQWRDNFRRVVPGRAQAYEPSAGGFMLDMPDEDIHGNGGLLTTVGDMLIWNAALTSGRLGPAITAQLQEPATVKAGRKVDYARGLFVSSYAGVPEVSHDGATAGYRAWLGRYPDQGLSVALLCNAGNVAASTWAHKVADLYLPPRPAAPPLAGGSATADELKSRPGIYVGRGALDILRVAAEGDHLRIQGGPPLQPTGSGAYKAGATAFVFRPDGALEMRRAGGEVLVFSHETPGWTPSPAELAAIAGTYRSDEADTVLKVTLKDGKLMAASADRPSAASPLNPIFKDGFARPGGLLRVVRGKGGKVEALRYKGGRVWDFTFRRVGS